MVDSTPTETPPELPAFKGETFGELHVCVTGANSSPKRATWLSLGAPVTSMGACGSPETKPFSLSRITGVSLNTHTFQTADLCLELYC